MLRQLGESFSKYSFQKITVELFQMKLAMGKKSDKKLVAPPKITDKRSEAALDIMSTIVFYTSISQTKLTQLLIFRMVRRTLKYGVSNGSSLKFALYSMFLFV